MTNIKMGDPVLCMNAEGLEETGLQYGVRYEANQVTIVPGQGEYVGVYVPSVGQIVVVDASRFEKAYILHYRVFHETKTYVLMDETFDEEAHKDKGESHVDITITLPESQLDHVEEALNHAVASILRQAEANEAAN